LFGGKKREYCFVVFYLKGHHSLESAKGHEPVLNSFSKDNSIQHKKQADQNDLMRQINLDRETP
ncbi:MAG: hypothetical protein OSJ83_10875, partial [Clostridia bacterium]|nr:hypothetical protein [Clostridia bacterium]